MPPPISLLLPFLIPALLTGPITAASPPPPFTPVIPGRQVYNLTCPALPPPLRRSDPDSCIDLIFRQLLTLQPASGHGFPFTTNPADAPRPEWTVPFTFPHAIPALGQELVIPDAMNNTSAKDSGGAEGKVATTSRHRRRSTTTTNAASVEGTKSSQCFARFDFWDREAGGPGYEHEEGWGMNLVSRYAGAAWDGCLRDQGQQGGGVGRVVPKPASATLRLVIEVLAVELDG